MAVTADRIMTVDGQELPFARDLREALGIYARRTWPLNTSGCAAQAWGLPKSTVANLLKGHASDGTVTAVLRKGGWPLARAVVGAVIGHSLEDFLASEIRNIHREQQQLSERAAQMDDFYRALSRPRLVAVGDPGRPAPKRRQARS